jgi:hypothetical protein
MTARRGQCSEPTAWSLLVIRGRSPRSSAAGVAVSVFPPPPKTQPETFLDPRAASVRAHLFSLLDPQRTSKTLLSFPPIPFFSPPSRSTGTTSSCRDRSLSRARGWDLCSAQFPLPAILRQLPHEARDGRRSLPPEAGPLHRHPRRNHL